MFSAFITSARLLRALLGAWKEAEFRAVLLLYLATLLSGTLFYQEVEGWSAVDSFYFSVMTLATIGPDGLAPQTPGGRLFTALYVAAGIGLFVALATQIARSLRLSLVGGKADD